MSDVVVAPTENEMATIRNMFSRAADAIVRASELGNRVTELEHQIDGFRRELETVKNTNAWLSDQLGTVRGQRDQLQHDLDHERAKNSALSQQVQEHSDTISIQQARINELEDKLRSREKESDDHLLRAMTAEEELAKVKAQMDEALGEVEDAVKKLTRVPKEVAPAIVPFPSDVSDSGSSEEPKTGTDPYRW